MTNIDLNQLADRIREQAAASTRIGQMGDLYDLADEVQQTVAELREARATIETLQADIERRKIRNTLSRMGMPDEPETIEAWRENTIGWMERAETAEATIERVWRLHRADELGLSTYGITRDSLRAALDGER